MRKTAHRYNLIFLTLFLAIAIFSGTGSAYAQKAPSKKLKCSPLSMLVLFKKNKFPQWDQLFTQFRKSWPKPEEVTKTVTEKGASFSIQGATSGNAPIFLSLSTSDKPTSRKFIDEAAIGTWWWQTARQEAYRQSGYVFLLVAPMGNNCLAAHVAMTKLTSIILEAENAYAVHLISSEMLMPKALFLSQAKNIGPGNLPMMLWIKTYMGGAKDKNGKPKLIARTVGMRNFGYMEIETNNAKPDHQYLLKMIWGLGSHLVQKGPIVADGHTIGRSQKERILVRHRISAFGTRKKVYSIDFGK